MSPGAATFTSSAASKASGVFDWLADDLVSLLVPPNATATYPDPAWRRGLRTDTVAVTVSYSFPDALIWRRLTISKFR